ncbi:MAG: TfoX/Sxy family protein [Burkholderiaceae bacterium]|nr:TfoX/Sxy family protein [Burkholderiaceae bacterium]
MASDLAFVTYVCEQASLFGQGKRLAHKKMFGEFALYFDEKVIALICDDQLFVKPTEAGRGLIENLHEAPPYPGAKPHFLISDEIENAEALSKLFAATAAALPMPKPKKPKKAKL